VIIIEMRSYNKEETNIKENIEDKTLSNIKTEFAIEKDSNELI
jgi:hypothetical protein